MLWKNRFVTALMVTMCILALCIPTVAGASSDSYTISCDQTARYGHTAGEWYSSSYNRAVLTCSLMMDAANGLGGKVSASNFLKDSYVGRVDSGSGSVLCIMMPYTSGGKEIYLLAIYQPTQNQMAVSGYQLTSAQAETMMQTVCVEYYANDKTDLKKAQNLVK